MDLKRDVTSALMWKLFERGGRALVELLIQIVMARLLAPADFGALAIMLVFVNLANVIVQSGLNTALIQASDVKSEDYSTVFWMSLALSAILYMTIYLLAPSISIFYGMSYLVWPLRGLAIVLIINALNSVQIAQVTRNLEMRKIFFSTIASVLASAIAGFFAAFTGAGLWALVIQQITYQVIGCIVLSFQIDWRPRAIFDVSRARKFFSFGWRLLASGLLEQAYQSLADLIIGKRFSPVQLGLVSQGKKYPLAIGSMLDGAIQPVMLSAVSHVQDDRNKVKRLVRRALKTSTFLIVPSMALFACCAPLLVPALLGPQWSEAVPFLQIYCFVYALLPIHTTNLQALNGMGRSDMFLKLELIKKFYGIIALFFCAFILNDIGALVISYLVTGILSTFVNAFPNKQIIGYSYREQIQDIAPAFLLSAIASIFTALIGMFGLPAFITFFLEVFIFLIVYFGFASIFKLETFSYLLRTLRSVVESRF